MAKKSVSTIKKLLFWSYANLAMAHAACQKGSKKYGVYHFKIRARLFSGLMSGTMKVGELFVDERLKMILPQCCCYCGSTNNLSADHIIPLSKGGANTGENLVWSCRSCNSSKGSKDMLVWLKSKGQFPPILLLRRYLKLAISYFSEADLMDQKIKDIDFAQFPFALGIVPLDYPYPDELKIWIVD